MNVVRLLLSLLLCVLLGAGPGVAAQGHGQPAGTRVAVICANGQEQTVRLDNQGQPIPPGDCGCKVCLCAPATQALAVPPTHFVLTLVQPGQARFFPRNPSLVPTVRVPRNARGPPLSQDKT